MSILFLMFATLVFGCVVIMTQVVAIKRQNRINLINIFALMYGITYGILTFIYTFMYEFMGVKVHRIDYSQTGINALWFWFMLSVFGYVFVLIFYNLTLKKNAGTAELPAIDDTEDSNRDYRRLQFTAVVCLIVGSVSLYLWARAYGGIFELIKVANIVRSGRHDVVNSLAFFKHPAKVVTFVSYIFLYLLKNKYHVVANVLLFGGSATLAVLYLLASDGRMTTVTYFVILFFILVDMFANKIDVTKKLGKIVVLGVVATVVILNLDAITHFIRTGEALEAISEEDSSLLGELSFIPAAGQTSIKNMLENGSENLLFHDILSAVFAWVPSSLTPDGLVDIWDYNTFVFSGSTKRGQLPTDFISTSVYDLGVFGIILLPLIWSRVIKIMDKTRRNGNSAFFKIAFCAFAMSVFRLPEYCMMADFVLSAFNIFVAGVVWKVSALFIPNKEEKAETVKGAFRK